MITFINVFTVERDTQSDALRNITRVYTEVVRQQPGFMSAKLFKSRDGKRVTAIAYWESAADLQAMRSTEKFKALHTPEFYAAIVSNDGHVYNEVIEIEK